MKIILLALVAACCVCVLPNRTLAAPSDDLLSYWTLDGNTTDSAPGGVSNDNGSWSGSAAYQAATFGQGADLNGSSYISIPSSSDLQHAGSSLSISVWFKVDTWNKSWQCLLSKGEGSNYRIARRSNDANQLSYAGGTGDISGGAVNDGQWHHAVAVSDHGNNMFLYIDGAQVALGGAPSLTDSGLPLYLGENPGATNRQWNGGIDDVGIFDVPLSSFQVAAIHQLGTDITYAYNLGEVVQVFDAHFGGPGSSAVVDGTTWQYAASDPGGASGFILLAGNGSGVIPSAGPTIASFSASPIFINSGQSTTLSWQVTPPYNTLSIDNGVGSVLASTDVSGAGSIGVSPTATTVYTLTATNVDGSTTAETTVFVDLDPTAPRINEFVADNGSGGHVDELGATEDWIELYAPGLADLSTYYLTDDVTIPNKWAFPAMSMSPDSYLVVFASGKDLTGNPNFLHTNFKLAGGGEYLALTKDDGMGGFDVVTEYSPAYPAQVEGYSYGLSSDQITTGFFRTPTPNAANGVAFAGFVEDTQFSVGRGFYTTAQTVAITTLTPGATIRYTTDGSTPTTSNGTVYSSALTIDSTTTLRAFAYKTGFESTNVDTLTYFFLEDIRTQFANGAPPTAGWPNGSSNGQEYNYGMDPDITNRYTAQQMKDALSAIPSMSVVTDLPNLVSASTGIYSNPGNHGSGWERPASLELINPDPTQPGFQIDAGIRIRGGFSRSKGNPKHAFRFFFRAEYGDSKLRFPLFGNEGADEFDKVDLRTSQNYSWAFQNDANNTFLREVLGRDLQGALGQPYTRSRYYHLYLNGVYWGLYMTQERAEANYGATYFKGSKDDFDTIKSAGSSGGYNTEATDGSYVQGSAGSPGSDWADLWFQSRDHNSSPSHAKYMEMQGLNTDGTRNPAYPVLLDVDNLIDYTLIIGYTGNYDAPLSNFVGASNNWYSVRNRVRDDRGVAFFVHDGEHSLGVGGGWGANDRINTSNGSASRGSYNKSNPAFVEFDIRNSLEYRMRFADRAHRALYNDGVLTTAKVLATMEERRQIVDQVIIAEAARWGDSKRSSPFDKPNWTSAVNSLISTINGRHSVFLGHLQMANLYPNLDAPVYNQHGGSVPSGFNVTMTNTSGVMYYMADGGDPRLVGGAINSAATLFDPASSNVTLFPLGDAWKYLDNDSDLGTSDLVVGHGSYNSSNWKHPSYNDSAWGTGNAPLGFGSVGVTLNTTIDGGPSGARYMTTYFRKSFSVTGASTFSSLILDIMRDDGAVVYLNGHEVARTNMQAGVTIGTETAAFPTSIGGTDESAINSIAIDATKLVEGTNVMTIEVHQFNSGSSDLGLDVRLTGVTNSAGIPITAPTVLNARSYSGGTWSALNSAFFTTGVLASSANIVISEVNYHPYDMTAAELASPDVNDADDFEFVEIMNISASVVELGGAAFVLTPSGDHLEGIEVTFPDGTLIQPGERLLVVANAAAFAIRYPGVSASKIIGDYSNRLDNTGEWITLQAADGSIIDQFRYNDIAPWPTTPDGAGPSLVVADPNSNPDHADPANWIASVASGGSPGESEPSGTPFTGNAFDDLDNDGGVALVEYLQGLSDTVSSAELFPDVAIADVGGTDYLTITFRQDPLAVDATVEVQLSTNLTDWTTIGVFVGSAPGPGGVNLQTYRSPNPSDPNVQEFVRLSVTLVP